MKSMGRLTMFLASLDGFGPVAGVLLLVVEQTADAELFDGRAVPAGPVADARRFVTEDAVLPVARADADGRICWYYLKKFNKNYYLRKI